FKSLKYGDGVVGENFFAFVEGFHELMGDVVGIEAANVYANQIAAPDKVTLDNGTVVLNPGTPNRSALVLRSVNQNASAGSNPPYYEWAYMYGLNNACNAILENVDGVSYTGDASSKKNVLKAWAYWWKGFAYARIGSMYIAGLIVNTSVTANPTPNPNYVTKEAIIAESNSNFDKAITILNAQANNADYQQVLGKLIPDFNQVGKGGILTPAMWVRNCNTMKARNILVNKTVTAMTPTDWSAVLTLANAGILSSDFVFTARSNANSDLMSTGAGTLVAKVTSNAPGTNTYKISERIVQDFPIGDKRKLNNFNQGTTWIGNPDRGNSFNTRWALKDGGNGLPGVIVYSTKIDGATEHYIAGTWEENQLMKAEATMYAASFSPASILAGMALIDAVRNAQGAGLPPTVAATAAAAKEELRKERRVGLIFHGLSFYDARRWKVIDPISSGGGRFGAIVLSATGVVSVNATIEYNFLDYWDVPDNELAYNPPAGGSAPVVNPRQ
ncbi:MAG: RagB/SusD family nutrient uptake outer membrane protein, partial [Bacteroidota bacterium]